ncbi:DUF2164 domain-containing protein [Shewanella gelidii]|uniref:DUF2164 domain-containing protein n=1 Tax=Shewanella gelidii TaxID=1642821 RepID=A0A917NDV4_9GAMM|nr:DUF2164 domain-containing protein [Shewanella gelidii]MCL1098179.1 DUF2164 domain-containing protein [Shewanella gelidii]GGI91163.1 hypothetical protein GCM10009332_30570 [Shewanella gelidii]
MAKIEFTHAETERMVTKLQSYFDRELNQELEQFDAEFLLDFFAKEMGAYYYNRGLHDARAIFEARVESIDDDIYAIEKELS